MAKGKRDRTPCSVSVANRLHYQQHNDTITRSCSCMTEVSEVTSPRRVLYDPQLESVDLSTKAPSDIDSPELFQ